MKKQIIIITIIFVVLILSGLYYFFQKNQKSAEINGHKFKLELAISREEKERGLSGRDGLCQECGMLFIFPQKGIDNFWMKDMQFDLDIIWISDGRIVYLAKNIAYDNKITIKPGKPADQVLEINAGLSDRYGLKEGDKVTMSY
ncbi:MAG: DUF192 domain-containing protein [Parcubacteria group bacterium]|jgi:hypothetical protein